MNSSSGQDYEGLDEMSRQNLLLERKTKLEERARELKQELGAVELELGEVQSELLTLGSPDALEKLVQCSVCQRSFFPHRVKRHESICKNVNSPEAIERRSIKRSMWVSRSPSPTSRTVSSIKFSPTSHKINAETNPWMKKKFKSDKKELHSFEFATNRTSVDNPLATSPLQTAWHPPQSPKGSLRSWSR
mmetsp:Transcript_10342/g.11879  ORF Transcript_10342/g.11879 Transcript_10342/m.11879 type:complete len:190 (+) Transcript_10342:183-752(+)